MELVLPEATLHLRCIQEIREAVQAIAVPKAEAVIIAAVPEVVAHTHHLIQIPVRVQVQVRALVRVQDLQVRSRAVAAAHQAVAEEVPEALEEVRPAEAEDNHYFPHYQ